MRLVYTAIGLAALSLVLMMGMMVAVVYGGYTEGPLIGILGWGSAATIVTAFLVLAVCFWRMGGFTKRLTLLLSTLYALGIVLIALGADWVAAGAFIAVGAVSLWAIRDTHRDYLKRGGAMRRLYRSLHRRWNFLRRVIRFDLTVVEKPPISSVNVRRFPLSQEELTITAVGGCGCRVNLYEGEWDSFLKLRGNNHLSFSGWRFRGEVMPSPKREVYLNSKPLVKEFWTPLSEGDTLTVGEWKLWVEFPKK